MQLPKDPAILLSLINTKLRDFYPSLDELCLDLELSQEDIINALSVIGYSYSIERNQFI